MEEYIDIIGSSDNELPGPSIDSSSEPQLTAILSEDTPLAGLGSSAGTRAENANSRRDRRQKSARRTSKRVRKAPQTEQHENSDNEQVDLSRLGHRLYCTICGQAGELEPCGTCPRAFHKTCLEKSQVKPSPRAPQWTCHLCDYISQEDGRLMAQPVSENVEKQCQMLLDHILQNDLSTEFVVPIPESDHEYHSIIDSPMDLTKIRIRLSQGHYRRSLNPGLRKPFGGLLRFLDDLLNVWCNALGYNMPKSAVHRQSEALQTFTKRYVEEKLVPFWADLGHNDFRQHYRDLVAKWQFTEEQICARAMTQITEHAAKSPRRTENSKRRRPGTEEGYPAVALENEATLPVGLARTIPKGARFVKYFLGKHYWGCVKAYNDPYFLCVYDDGDQEDLSREEIDKYLADTYKLLLAGIAKPPQDGWIPTRASSV